MVLGFILYETVDVVYNTVKIGYNSIYGMYNWYYQVDEKEENTDKEVMKNELKDYLKNLSATKNEKKIENAGVSNFNEMGTSFSSY